MAQEGFPVAWVLARVGHYPCARLKWLASVVFPVRRLRAHTIGFEPVPTSSGFPVPRLRASRLQCDRLKWLTQDFALEN